MAPENVNVYVKCEAFNPMGSVKDRLALGCIEVRTKMHYCTLVYSYMICTLVYSYMILMIMFNRISHIYTFCVINQIIFYII
jgi:hypothetical protein